MAGDSDEAKVIRMSKVLLARTVGLPSATSRLAGVGWTSRRRRRSRPNAGQSGTATSCSSFHSTHVVEDVLTEDVDEVLEEVVVVVAVPGKHWLYQADVSGSVYLSREAGPDRGRTIRVDAGRSRIANSASTVTLLERRQSSTVSKHWTRWGERNSPRHIGPKQRPLLQAWQGLRWK